MVLQKLKFMLYLIGIGFDEKDLTLKGMEIAKSCDAVFCELYTSDWKGELKKLEEILGKKIKILERSDLEERLEEWIKTIKDKNVALLVPGDPLVATTHASVILEVKKQGISTRVIHAPSIYSAIAACGLQLYKFGKVATIPQTEQIENVRKVVEENLSSGAHTLLLLDIGMSGKRGLEILLKNGIVKPENKIILASRIGMKDEKIKFGECRKLLNENFESPCVIIIPGKLHFAEEEFLKNLE